MGYLKTRIEMLRGIVASIQKRGAFERVRCHGEFDEAVVNALWSDLLMCKPVCLHINRPMFLIRTNLLSATICRL